MPYTYEYPHFALTADAVLFSGTGNNRKVLLIQRKHDPYKDRWAFPGGFVDIDERIDDAVVRELREETGISGIDLKRFDVYDAPGRDPRERTVTLIYYGYADENILNPEAGDDAKAVSWFRLNEIPELAFDHGQILSDLLKKVSHP